MTQLEAQVSILLDVLPYNSVINNYLTFFFPFIGYELVGRFIGSVKQADAPLKKSRDEWPVAVLEVGIGEPHTSFTPMQNDG